MSASYSLNFQRPPSLWMIYPRVLAARKPSQVGEGRAVPRIEAQLTAARIDAAHLARYEQLCGAATDQSLPLCYPHILASPLHLAVLSAEKFPVGLLGLVHIRNRIEQTRAIARDSRGNILVSIEGHRETERGQEFDLHTQWREGREIVWSEVSTFLARRRSGSVAAKGSSALKEPAPDPADQGRGADASTSFRAPAGLGRQYGWVSGDLNPIHLSDVTARAFGFRQAIAHGMWTMARCAAEFSARVPAHCILELQFKLPIYLPSWVMLRSWNVAGGVSFTLFDSQGDKPHLTGSLVAA